MKKYGLALSAIAIIIGIGLYVYTIFFASNGEFCLFATKTYDSIEKEWKAKNLWIALRTSETKDECNKQSNEVIRSMLKDFKDRCASGQNLEEWMTPFECKELLKKQRMVTIFDVTTWEPANQKFDSCMRQHGFNKVPSPKVRACNDIGGF
ncbi:hypothetical protein [Paraburkholderia sp. J10-1]|uniref:hypothetical protein n=1 Tax=Paraburkholderia sp. J10-1 TaxID=2805430 RepID=UPI002AB6EC22|nr:hypothetical protein [Paraburkholderia sp. J10-1]